MRGSNSIVESEWFTRISHEVRTPLASILGFADLLASEGDFEHTGLTRASAVTRIREHGTRVIELVEKLTDLARLDSNAITPSIDWLNLREWVVELASRAELAPESNVKLDYDFDSAAPDRIRTDRSLLDAVASRLLENAARFTPKGEIQIRVLARSAARFQLSVSDTGQGISASRLNDLFTPFACTEVESGRSYGGSGLGLAIARHRLELIGGQMHVTSSPGVGSDVVLDLPLIADAPSSDGLEAQRPGANA